MSLPTTDEIIDAFRSQNLRPTGRITEDWTSKGVHCACALTAVAFARGESVSRSSDLVKLFGPDASAFMFGWDRPGGLYRLTPEDNGATYVNTLGEQGARAWWDCVKA